jgi:hypothetical protein
MLISNQIMVFVKKIKLFVLHALWFCQKKKNYGAINFDIHDILFLSSFFFFVTKQIKRKQNGHK